MHCIWKVLATTKTGAYIKRVPTLENIADLPSRCDGRPTFILSVAGIRIYIQGMLRPFGKAARATEKRLISVHFLKILKLGRHSHLHSIVALWP